MSKSSENGATLGFEATLWQVMEFLISKGLP